MDRRVTVGDIAKELECEVVAGKAAWTMRYLSGIRRIS